MVLLAHDATETLTFSLWPARGAIEVQVVDELGAPISGARVFRHSVEYVNGERRIGAASPCGMGAPCRTDDRGHVRLFGLLPGEYVLSTEVPPALQMALPSRELQGQEGYVRTFYPGTTSADAAFPLAIASGQEILGLTLPAVRARLAPVSGRIVRWDGLPMTGRDVVAYIHPLNESGSSSLGFRIADDGHFVIPALSPGRYLLQVLPRPEGSRLLATVEVTIAVNGDPISDLVLTVGTGSAARGRVESETGGVPENVRPEQVRVRGHGLTMLSQPLPTPIVREDWTFEVQALTGERRLIVSAPAPWRLARIMLGARDVTDAPLDFSGDVEGLTIVLTQRASGISGSVTNRDGSSIDGYVVVVFAEDSSKWEADSRFIARANPDQNGSYSVRGLPPDRYIAVAVEALPRGAELDPQRLRELTRRGTRFTLGEYEVRTLNLTIER